MYELLKTMKSSLRTLVVLMILAYPILGLLQWFAPAGFRPFDTYNLYVKEIIHFVLEYGDWIIILYVSYSFAYTLQPFYKAAETIRRNRLLGEFARWSRTPYIAPVHYYYLMAPQPAFDPSLHAQVTNTFNTEVMNLFRNRVYVNAHYTDHKPGKKVTWVQAVGIEMIVSVAVGLAFISGFFLVLGATKSPELWFTGAERFFIPVLIVISSWVGQKMYAMLRYGNGELLYKKIDEYFGNVEPLISWREMFPDRPYGQNLLRAWEANIEVQQRQYNYYKGRPLPNGNIMTYDNPLLPPYPYPANAIPEWVNDAEAVYEDKKAEWAYKEADRTRQIAKSSKGKVVMLTKNKRAK